MKSVLMLLLFFAILHNPKQTQGYQEAFSSIMYSIMRSPKLESASSILNCICANYLDRYPVSQEFMPNVEKMYFKYMTPSKNYSIPFTQPIKLWENMEFRRRVEGNKQLKIVILATGWTNNVNNSAGLWLMSKAFLYRRDVAFIMLDVANYVNTYYSWAALNTKEIGALVGKGLTELVKVVPLENIHLVGHSLGAHIMGAAGRKFAELTGQKISRITGLDPAKPCFASGNRLLNSLRSGDAQFVDIIHTNIGVLGKKNPIGDVDFYPGGAQSLPPGCEDASGAHFRAIEYFAESVYPGNEQSFLGYKCANFRDLECWKCSPQITAQMGYLVNRQSRGIYYVHVEAQSPFGKCSLPAFKGVGSLYICPMV